MMKKGFILVLLCLLLPGLVLAELPRSQFQGDVPPPEVPKRERVAESYFDDAVFIGDSIMASLELHGMFPDSHYAAAVGIGPQNAMGKVYDTNTGKKNLHQVLVALTYTKLYVLLGANTLDTSGSGVAAQRYNDFLAQLVTAYPDKLIYVISIPPRTHHPQLTKPIASQQPVVSFNQSIREMCRSYGIYYLDVFTAMMGPDDKPDASLLAGDGLHLSRKGSDMVQEYLMTHTVREAQ